MRISTLSILLAGAALAAPGQAQEDFSVNWHTVDCGGGTSNGEEFVIIATIAQPEAGNMSGGGDEGEAFSITGGFWGDGGNCYPNCDGSTGNPVLTPNDFQCYMDAYVSGRSYANCDGSSGIPALTPNDFMCFLSSYANGCP